MPAINKGDYTWDWRILAPQNMSCSACANADINWCSMYTCPPSLIGQRVLHLVHPDDRYNALCGHWGGSSGSASKHPNGDQSHRAKCPKCLAAAKEQGLL